MCVWKWHIQALMTMKNWKAKGNLKYSLMNTVVTADTQTSKHQLEHMHRHFHGVCDGQIQHLPIQQSSTRELLSLKPLSS